jgi:outer membrane lipoprotein carrier protein
LWLYDIDLEQVTVKRLDQTLSAAPLAVLSGAAPIEQEFEVSRIVSSHDDLQWYELTPKQQQSEFNLLRIGFEDNVLRILELEDNFQRRTRLDLDQVERNPALDAALFHFIPPPGVDVVGDL